MDIILHVSSHSLTCMQVDFKTWDEAFSQLAQTYTHISQNGNFC
jgi:hypothetical protein